MNRSLVSRRRNLAQPHHSEHGWTETEHRHHDRSRPVSQQRIPYQDDCSTLDSEYAENRAGSGKDRRGVKRERSAKGVGTMPAPTS